MTAPSKSGSSRSKAPHSKFPRVAEASRQTRAVAASAYGRDDQAFIDAVSELGGE